MIEVIPDVIYLQWSDEDGEHDQWTEVTWCQNRIHATDIEYYRRLTTASTVTAAPVGLWDNVDDSDAAAGEP